MIVFSSPPGIHPLSSCRCKAMDQRGLWSLLRYEGESQRFLQAWSCPPGVVTASEGARTPASSRAVAAGARRCSWPGAGGDGPAPGRAAVPPLVSVPIAWRSVTRASPEKPPSSLGGNLELLGSFCSPQNAHFPPWPGPLPPSHFCAKESPV